MIIPIKKKGLSGQLPRTLQNDLIVTVDCNYIKLKLHDTLFNAIIRKIENSDATVAITKNGVPKAVMIGMKKRRIEAKLWAAIFTQRGEAIRIISVRRARRKEAALYEKEKRS